MMWGEIIACALQNTLLELKISRFKITELLWMLQNNAWRDSISLWIIPDLILLGILQECAKAEMEGAPALVGVLKRKINGRKHSESYFSLGTPLLCWSVSASKQRKDPSREIQHKWAFPLPLMENFITWPFSWWLFDGFMGWGVPSWGMGTVYCPCPSLATLKEKKKSGKTNCHLILCGNYFEY